jgi:hypothetical protein
MYARVARFEGAAPGALERVADEIKGGPPEPPPGVPATGFLMLAGEDGSSVSIAFFDSEEDLRKGDAALSEMTPSEDGGHRVALDTYEVAVDIRL